MKLNETINPKNQEIVKEKKTFTDLQEQVIIFKEKTGKSFSSFFEKYHPKLVYYITKICKDDCLAQDLALESFIIGLEKIDKYNQEKSQFSTWLFTIAKNATLQEIKERNRFVSMDVSIDSNGTSIKDFLSDSTDVDIDDITSKNISIMKANIVKAGIKKLKQPYRQVIEMREIENMSYKEIASELGSDINFNIEISENNDKIELPKELSYITHIINSDNSSSNSNNIPFNLVEGNVKKTPFYTHINNLPKGTYTIIGRVPYNLSTLKSQIRNGRVLLDKMVKKDFSNIIELYGDC